MQKILIALDYNPTAQKIAEQGYALAKSMNAHVTLLHVISDVFYYSDLNYSPIMGFYGNEYFSTVNNDDLTTAAYKFLNKTKEFLGDNVIEVHVEQGEVAESILKIAEKINCNIIVMGTHSKKWLEKIMLGSVAEAILSDIKIPLFIIPTRQ